MFTDFKVFKTYVRRVFEDIDVKRTIVRELINLEQKKVTLMYAAQF